MYGKICIMYHKILTTMILAVWAKGYFFYSIFMILPSKASRRGINMRIIFKELFFIANFPIMCVMSLSSGETASHLLLRCPIVYGLWTKVLKTFYISALFLEKFDEFLIQWSAKKKLLQNMWHAISWNIWIERNKKIFRDRFAPSFSLGSLTVKSYVLSDLMLQNFPWSYFSSACL